MTTQKITYRIHDLDENICKVTREELEDIIATVEISALYASGHNGDFAGLRSYIIGRDARGLRLPQLAHQSDEALLKLWDEEARKSAAEMKAAGTLLYDIELQIDPEADEITDWTQDPIVQIEGREDGKVIWISRAALETRLLGYLLSCEESSSGMRGDGPFAYAVREGHKGHVDFSLDDLTSEWGEVRPYFYGKQADGEIPIPMESDDPEFGH